VSQQLRELYLAGGQLGHNGKTDVGRGHDALDYIPAFLQHAHNLCPYVDGLKNTHYNLWFVILSAGGSAVVRPRIFYLSGHDACR